MEFGGSPALKRSASCLIDSGRCSREELFIVKNLGKKSRSQLSRARGKSLLETLQTGACAHQGSRSSMEDVFRVILWNEVAKKTTHTSKLALQNDACSDLEDGAALSPESTCKIETGNLERVSFFAVFDGHGGIQAADFVNDHLFNNIINQNSFGEDPEAAILSGFEETEKAFAKHAEEKDLDGLIGTTVTAALIAGNRLFIANLGDSEAIIYSQGQERVLTQSHVPSNNEEKKRVESAGGLIVTDKLGNCRLGHPNWNPNFVNIGVTRAIGDLYFKSESYLEGKVSGLIATPTISKVCLTLEDDFVIIASDGFWDVVTYKEAANFTAEKIKEKINSDVICKQLIQLSNDRKSKDNITVLLVVLNAPP